MKEELEKEEISIEELRPQEREMIVLNLVERSSEGYSNYKSNIYLIYKQPERVKYEDSYVMNVKTKTIYCGMYQPYRCYDIYRLLIILEGEGFVVMKVFEP